MAIKRLPLFKGPENHHTCWQTDRFFSSEPPRSPCSVLYCFPFQGQSHGCAILIFVSPESLNSELSAWHMSDWWLLAWWMNLEYDSSLEICVTGKFIIQMSKVETQDMDSCDHLLVISEIIFQETLLAGHLDWTFLNGNFYVIYWSQLLKINTVIHKKTHWIVSFRWVNYMVYELYLSKTI